MVMGDVLYASDQERRVADDFNWNNLDEGVIVVREAREMAIYSNTVGDVVIRQQRAWDEEEDPFLVIPFDRIPALIARLQALYKENTEGK
jgi:hypothetical protein